MKDSSKSFFRAFIPAFLATVLGILLTLGVDSLSSARRREKTAKLLAEQIVGKMDRTYRSLMNYQELYDYVRFLHELPEFNVYYSRMQNVRLTLQEIAAAMEAELCACKEILHPEESY